MKVSHNWLKELVQININPNELSEKLSIGGFEVESLTDCSSLVNGVVLGKVIDVEKHKDSSKLSICKVDVGLSKNLQIVCGANNVRPNIYVYVAKVGSYLSFLDLTIKNTEIRGVLSEGMICSLEELGLETNSEGIAIIEENIAERHNLGSLAKDLLLLDDYIFDLAITANRPDGMSVIGIAREVSALLKTKLSLPEINDFNNFKNFKPNYLSSYFTNNNGIYTISFIDNVNGSLSSPLWMKDRIEKSGIKSINLLVDITNYILLEQGQPLHAFDKDKLSSILGREVNAADFGVRNAKEGETLKTLDGNTYTLNENVAIIVCSDMPIAIAGVIGGFESSVSEATTSIVLEAAVFNPVSIRKSSKEIGIRTESSSRFEKGISYKNTINSLSRALNVFDQFFPNIQPEVFVSRNLTDDSVLIKLRKDRINKILGPIINKKENSNDTNITKRFLSDEEIIEKLELIGCKLISKDYGWDVKVIPNRAQDLVREIDLIEEIARLIGYDLFDQNIPYPIKPGTLNPSQLAQRKLKNGFVESGFQEVLTYSLVPQKSTKRIEIANPLLSETSCLRDNIWEEHLKICNQNINSGSRYCWIFEIGNVFYNSPTISQEEIINGVIFGKSNFGKWNKSLDDENLNYYEARGKLNEAISSINVELIDEPTNKHDFLHPGRSALLKTEGREIGYFGQIHPRLVLDKKLNKIIYIFSLKLKNILEASTRKNKWIPIFKSYPIVPKMERDINLIFYKKIIMNNIISHIKQTGKKLLEEVALIDVYNDSSLGEDNISYTFRLSYRDKNKTLNDDDINDLHNNIINSLEKKFEARLR